MILFIDMNLAAKAQNRRQLCNLAVPRLTQLMRQLFLYRAENDKVLYLRLPFCPVIHLYVPMFQFKPYFRVLLEALIEPVRHRN